MHVTRFHVATIRLRKKCRTLRVLTIGALSLMVAGCTGLSHDASVTAASGTQFTVSAVPGSPYLVMDIQGVLWRLPVTGGSATALTGPDDDMRWPQLSPDGTQVALQAFRNGRWQPGLIDINGQHLTLLDSTRSLPAWVNRALLSGNLSAVENAAGTFSARIDTLRRNPFPGVASHAVVLKDLLQGSEHTVSLEGADVFTSAPTWLDDDTLLYTANGKVQRYTVADGQTTTIPFTVRLPLRHHALQAKLPLAFKAQTNPVRGIVDPVMLSDGRIAFTALGDLWLLTTRGELVQLTNDAFVERDLAVSHDGTALAYISDRSGTMQLWLHTLSTGAHRQISFKANGPRYPTFAPDDQSLAYLQVGPRGTQDFGLRILNISTGATQRLRSAPGVWPGRLAWSADGTHVTVAELHSESAYNGGRNRLVRINIATDTATVAELPNGAAPDFGPVASADGRTLALIIDGALWLQAVSDAGHYQGEPQRLLDELVESPAWGPAGEQLLLLTERGMESLNLTTGVRTPRTPALDWQPLANAEPVIVHAGRLFDGEQTRYRNNVDIVVAAGRIVSVDTHTTHPADAHVIDAGGLTVLPGLIDQHVHFEPHKGEWVGRALLGFGITTVVEPGGLPYESREHLEAWASGRRLGPRLVYAGPQLDGAGRSFYFAAHVNSEERLQRELQRGERLGYGLLKTYTRLSPALQARAIELGHQQGLLVTAHDAYRNAGQGGDRVEHLRGSSRLPYSDKQSALLNSYADVEGIIAASGASITPTLVNQGAFFNYLARNPQVQAHPLYTGFYTPAYRKGLAGFGRMIEKNNDLIQTGLTNAQAALLRLHNQGVNIVAGTDSPIFPYGLALTVELASYVDAGLSPAEAIQTATRNAAVSMGASQDIGRVAPGLLADLLFVDGDPLANINDLLNCSGVMKNGVYHDGAALLRSPDAHPALPLLSGPDAPTPSAAGRGH